MTAPAPFRARVGDVAVISRSLVPENVGRLVKVLGRDASGLKDWHVVSLGSPLSGVDRNGQMASAMRIYLHDGQLRPLFAAWTRLPTWPAVWRGART